MTTTRLPRPATLPPAPRSSWPIVVIFAVAGPPIGSLAFLLCFAAYGFAAGVGTATEHTLMFVLLSAPFLELVSYVFGLPPAAATGEASAAVRETPSYPPDGKTL